MECHESIIHCSRCLKLSVPELLASHNFSDAQKEANKYRDSWWAAFSTWDKPGSIEHHRSDMPPRYLAIYILLAMLSLCTKAAIEDIMFRPRCFFSPVMGQEAVAQGKGRGSTRRN
eukprot:scaffold251079_cov32-Prasinocladus_malaysianus.AAC.1